MKLTNYISKKAILKRKIKQTIYLCPNHWFSTSVLNIERIPDVTYAFYQTLEMKFRFFPRNKAEVKFIRKVFQETYINEFKGEYKLDLEKTFSSPLDYIEHKGERIYKTIGIKYLKHHKGYFTHSKNISLKKRLKLLKKQK